MTISADWAIPRETRELVGPIVVEVDGVVVEEFEVALIKDRTRPLESDWADTSDVEGEHYLLVGVGTPRVLEPGIWAMWARYTANPERPVVPAFAYVLVE